MTKAQILKLTGLTEAEFYKKYPTKESFYRDYPNLREGNTQQMQMGGSMSAPGVTPESLNRDQVRKERTYMSPAEQVFAGLGAGIVNTLTGGATSGLFKKAMEDKGVENTKAYDITSGLTQGLGTTAMSFIGAGGGGNKNTDSIKTGIPSTSKATGQFAPKLIQSGFKASDFVKGMYGTPVRISKYGGTMYQDGGPMVNQNMGLTEIDGPSHEQGGVTLPNDGTRQDVEVEGPETIYTPENYVMSEKMKASKQAIKMSGLPKRFTGKSYADISKSVKKGVDALRPNDKLAQRSVDKMMDKVITAHEFDREMKRMREQQNVVAQTSAERAGGYNMFPGAESIMFPGQGQTQMVPTEDGRTVAVTGADGMTQMLNQQTGPVMTQLPAEERMMAKEGGQMIKRKDGSYSRRGLWDNIRANRGSGRKPTKEMLEQERKIKAAEKAMGGYMYDNGGYMAGDGSDQPDGSFWTSDDSHIYMYGGDMDSYPQMMASGGKWIQKAVKGMRKDKPCTGSKFGGPTCPPGSKRYNLAKTFRKMAKSRKEDGGYMEDYDYMENMEDMDMQTMNMPDMNMYASGGKLPEGILRARLESHMSPAEADNYLENYAMGGSFDNPGFKALPKYVQEKIKSNMAMGGAMEYGSGGYTVRRTSERKGKTHVVTGPDGTKKYFGDPNMGERGKSKYGKEAFYARHKKNLAKNPYFRAYARATWAYGGDLDTPNYEMYVNSPDYYMNAEEYRDGGIYIKPSKRGTFTAAAKKRGMGVQEFASKVMANKEDYSPAMVKKANFARNAAKWKKEDGGKLYYQQNQGYLPKFTTNPIATKSDSLALLNSVNRLNNFYRTSGFHNPNPNIDAFSMVERSKKGDEENKSLRTYLNMLQELKDLGSGSMRYIDYKAANPSLTVTDYARKLGNAINQIKNNTNPYVGYYKDLYPSKIDIEAPSAVYDSRIAPQGHMSYEAKLNRNATSQRAKNYLNNHPYQSSDYQVDLSSGPAGSVSGFYYYDPLAIAPWDTLSEAQLQQRIKKYGMSGIPKKYTPSKTNVNQVTPVTSVTTNQPTIPQIPQPTQGLQNVTPLTEEKKDGIRLMRVDNPSSRYTLSGVQLSNYDLQPGPIDPVTGQPMMGYYAPTSQEAFRNIANLPQGDVFIPQNEYNQNAYSFNPYESVFKVGDKFTKPKGSYVPTQGENITPTLKKAFGGKLYYQQDYGYLPSYGYGAIDQFEDTSGTFIRDPNSPDYGKPMGMQKGFGYAQYGKDNVGKLTVKEIEDYAINTIGKDTWNKIPDDLKTLWYDASFNSRPNKEYFLRGLAQAIQDSDPNFQYPATMGSTSEDYKNYRNNMTDAEALDIIRKANFNDPNMDIAGNYINILNQQRESLGKRSNFPKEYMKTYNRRAIDVYNNFQNLKNQANQNSITTNNTTTTPVVNQPVDSTPVLYPIDNFQESSLQPIPFRNSTITPRYGTYNNVVNPSPEQMETVIARQAPAGDATDSNRILGSFKIPKVSPFAKIAAMAPGIANAITAATATIQPETPLPVYQRLNTRPGQLAIEAERNAAIANMREGLRSQAPTQGAFLGNIVGGIASLGAKAGQSKLANLIEVMNRNAAIQQAEAQARFTGDLQNKTIRQQEEDALRTLGLAGVQELSKGIQGISRDDIATKMDLMKIPLLSQGRFAYVPGDKKGVYNLVFNKNYVPLENTTTRTTNRSTDDAIYQDDKGFYKIVSGVKAYVG